VEDDRAARAMVAGSLGRSPFNGRAREMFMGGP